VLTEPEPLVEVAPYLLIDPGAHVYPASQFIHVAELVAPAVVEYVPAGQFVHVAILVAPIVVENVPAGQFMHDVAPSPEYFPAPQMLDADPVPIVDVLPY